MCIQCMFYIESISGSDFLDYIWWCWSPSNFAIYSYLLIYTNRDGDANNYS